MNEILEKIFPPSIVVFLAWIGSFEIRLRGKVSEKRFNDMIIRLNRIENLLIRIDKNNGR